MMHPSQYGADEETDAALAREIRLLQKNRNFHDAFYLGKILLERCSNSEGKLTGFIRDAYEANLLNECAEFLVFLARKRPDDGELLNYTAGLLGGMGRREESRAFAGMSAACRPFFLSKVKNARMHVLALQCIATADYRYGPLAGRFFMPGLTNLITLLDPGIAVHRLLVDDLPAAMEAAKHLPECDLVFNAISDPDYEEPLRNAATLCDMLKLPVFNHPRQVRTMNRASLPAILREKSDKLMAARSLFLPPGKTENSDIALAMRNSGLKFPVIVRAAGFQGGQQMALVGGSLDELGEELYRDNGLYVIEFIDVSFRNHGTADCFFYPKYRAFFADGRLFPIHLFISEQYEVHRTTSEPGDARRPWRLEMEAEFLRDPERHFPEGLWNELRGAMSSFGLDYFGVDFALSSRPEDSGKLVLFECNPAMRNKIALLPEGDPLQRQWHAVTLAAHAALCGRSGVEPWRFALKKGLLLSTDV